MQKIKIICKNCNKTTKQYDEINKILENCCSIDCKVTYNMAKEKEKIKEQCKALPYETKQKFLDLFRGGKSIGEAKDELNLSLDVACEIINENLECINILRSEAKKHE